ncbi:MAG TPA: hypothetical protein VEF04_09995, partial [Blastocatellia bacterium]|nr:hypothetical protein [Blastocatellia bacterium]
FFYPFLMRNDAPPPIKWEELPHHHFTDEAQIVSFPTTTFSLIALSLTLIVLAMRRLKWQ